MAYQQTGRNGTWPSVWPLQILNFCPAMPKHAVYTVTQKLLKGETDHFGSLKWYLGGRGMKSTKRALWPWSIRVGSRKNGRVWRSPWPWQGQISGVRGIRATSCKSSVIHFYKCWFYRKCIYITSVFLKLYRVCTCFFFYMDVESFLCLQLDDI